MPHMVVFRTNEGQNGYHPAETLDDAVRFVEHLRNNEQVSESKVYRMQEVPIEFKVMYKVEVAGAPGAPATDESGSAESAPTAAPGPGALPPRPATAPDGAEPLRATTAPGPTGTAAASPIAQSGGRFGLFSRTGSFRGAPRGALESGKCALDGEHDQVDRGRGT